MGNLLLFRDIPKTEKNLFTAKNQTLYMLLSEYPFQLTTE